MEDNKNGDKARPKIGIGVIVWRDGKILLGERISSHGMGTFSLPGGHLEFGESFEDAALREVEEETGLKNLTIKEMVSIGNDIAYDKHYVTIGILAESREGEPIAVEPEKTKNWQWYNPDHLPELLFSPSKKILNNWSNGQIYVM